MTSHLLFRAVEAGDLHPGHPVLMSDDDLSAAYMTKRKPGEIVRAEVKRLRNPHQHRLYWALIGLCFEHQTQFATRDQLHNAVKVWLGYCDTVTDKAGREIAIPKSIAFGNMPADQWHDFFNRFIALVCERIIPGTDDAELRATLEDMVGVPHG